MTKRMSEHLPYIIDLEASGFGPHSYPIEVGVVCGDDTRYCSLIKPASHWTFWSEEAEAQHRIRRETLMEYGRDVRTVALQLNELLSGTTVYSDGWVVDQPWLIELFATAGLSMQFRISPLEMILTEPQMNVWHQAKNAVQQQMSLDRHRASNDALIIQQTFALSQQLAQAV